MSPEQLSGDPLDSRSDIYALGLVTFNMLTGKLPFPGETMQETMIMRLTDDPHPLSKMKPDVAWPGDLQAVMDKALARDANKRYRNASEYATDLVQAIDRMPATSITTMGTQIVGRVSHGSMPTVAAEAAVAVPKTRVASKDEATPPAARPAASPAHTPTKSKMGMYATIGGVLVAAGVTAAVILKPGGGKPGPDSANSPVQAPAETSKVVSTGAPAATPPVNQLNQPISPAVADSLGLYEREVKALDMDDTTGARGVLNRAVRLDPQDNVLKIRRALVVFDANLILDKQAAGCSELLGVKEMADASKDPAAGRAVKLLAETCK
jgi:hypothetical protein